MMYPTAEFSDLVREVFGFAASPGAVGELVSRHLLEGDVEAGPAGVESFGRV